MAKNEEISHTAHLFDNPMIPVQGRIWPSDWKLIVSVLLLYKLLFAFVVVLALVLLPNFFDLHAWYGNFQYPFGAEPSLISRITTWDAQHYLFLSYEGIPGSDHPSAAFAQGWPLIIKAGGYLTGGNHAIAGLLIANLLSIFAFTLLFQFIRLHFGRKVSLYAMALLIAFPGSMFYSALYAESLLLLLNVLFFASLYQGRYASSAVLTLFQPIARSIGVVTFVPFLFHTFNQWRTKGKSPLLLLWCVAPLIGWLATFFIMWLYTGDPLTGSRSADFYKAQGSLLFVFDPIRLIHETFAITNIHAYMGSLVDRLWMIPLTYSLFILWKIDKELFLYSLAMILISAMVPRYASFTRYICVIFPVFIAYGHFFSDHKRKIFLPFSIVALVAMQVIFIIRYVNNLWVG